MQKTRWYETVKEKSIDELSDIMILELTEGIGRTGISSPFENQTSHVAREEMRYGDSFSHDGSP